jgi:hypothetical protein
MPDDATVDRAKLARGKNDGERSVRSGLRELAEAGYLIHRRVQNERGQWRTEAVVYESPRRASTEGTKSTIGRQPADGGFRASSPSDFKDRRRGPRRSPPSEAPDPPEYPCAACGASSEFMRADGTWLCDEHRARLYAVSGSSDG